MTATSAPIVARPAAPRAEGAAELPSGSADLLILASLMLGYPDDATCESRAGVAAALTQVTASPARGELMKFADWWVQADPEQLRRDYVDTFDTRRGAALYVTYRTFGDNRERGQALFDLKQLYRSAGFAPSGDELPDYLPAVCQFAALAPAPAARAALESAREATQAIRDALARRSNPYAHVLAAIAMIIEKGVRTMSPSEKGVRP